MIRKYLLAALLAIAGSVHAVTVTMAPSAPTVQLGNPFTVNLDISGVTDLYAWEIDVAFGLTSQVNATGQTEGAFLGAGTMFDGGTADNVGGAVTMMFNTLTGPSGVSGGGTLATIAFDSLDVGIATFSFTRVLLLDSNLQTIFISNIDDWISGSIEIVRDNGTPVPAPATAALCVLALALGSRARRRRA